MQKRTFMKSVAAGLFAAALAPSALAQEAAKSGYSAVNGVRYYYEITGRGEPILLLHGGLFTIGMYKGLRAALAKSHTVIAVDLRGHGRTALGNRPVDPVEEGADMAAFARSIGYDKLDVVGHSMGGGFAFQLALQHPELVRRLVLVSTPFARDGFFPEILSQQVQVTAAAAPALEQTPMYQAYKAVAPDPSEFPRLLDEMGAYMSKPYDWSPHVSQLGMPVMLIYGDSDMFRPEHEIRFYQLLGGGLRDAGWTAEHKSRNRLAILPGVTHYDMIDSPQLAPTVLQFISSGEGAQ